jgi:hypothetical protein
MPGLSPDKVLAKDRNGKISTEKRPNWASDPKLVLSKEDVEKFNKAELGIPPRLQFEGKVLKADIVFRKDSDIIFHFQGIRNKDFRQILAEVLDAHFGSTDAFKFDPVPELPDTFGLLAKGVRLNPLFSLKFYVEDFLWLLDRTLVELRKETR